MKYFSISETNKEGGTGYGAESIMEAKQLLAYESCLHRARFTSCCPHEIPRRAVKSVFSPGALASVCQNSTIFLLNISKLSMPGLTSLLCRHREQGCDVTLVCISER